VYVKHFIGLTLLLVAATLGAQDQQSRVQQKFISGGSISMHLESGGYTIRQSDAPEIVVTYHADSEDALSRVKVVIDPGPSTADLYIRNTPNNHFNAVIEVPRRSNLRVRLTAGQLTVEPIEGDKDLEIRAGQLEVAIPDPDDYGHRDASVLTGSIEASAFNVSKGGMFRSFEQSGPGKFRLHAHVMSGEIDLRQKN
jgi:hypothetical protein